MGSLLVGRNTSKVFYNDFTTRPLEDTANDALWRVVPAVNLRFGLFYEKRCSCLGWNLEVGYEVLTYVKSISTIAFTNGDSGTAAPVVLPTTNTSFSIDQYSDVSLHGPYVALAITF